MATLESKFMMAQEVPTEPGKTRKFFIGSKSQQSLLGEVKRYPAWRQYCFLPAMNCVFSAGCLRDIETFLAALMVERKGGV